MPAITRLKITDVHIDPTNTKLFHRKKDVQERINKLTSDINEAHADKNHGKVAQCQKEKGYLEEEWEIWKNPKWTFDEKLNHLRELQAKLLSLEQEEKDKAPPPPYDPKDNLHKEHSEQSSSGSHNAS